MKKKTLLTAILTMVMCLSLSIGATFALFTDEAKVNIAVTSAKVDVNASVTSYTSGSVYGDTNFTVVKDDEGAFALQGMAIGDWATFEIKAENASDIDVKWQVITNVSGELAPALAVEVSDSEGNVIANGEATKWIYRTVGEGTDIETYTVKISLPSSGDDATDSTYMGKTAKVSFSIKAVQGNAPIYVDEKDDLAEAIANGGNVILQNDVDLGSTVIKIPAGKTVSLDLNGKTISGTCSTNQNMFGVATTAKLTIKDSVGTGKITYAGNNSTGFVVHAEGNLVMESGTLELTGTWDIGYAVDVRTNAWSGTYEASVFTMNGGKIITSDNSGAGAVRVTSSSVANYPGASSAFVMNGGEIDVAKDGIFVQVWSLTEEPLKVTVNGGTIKSDLHVIRIYSANATISDDYSIEINLGSNANLIYTGTAEEDYVFEGALICRGGAASVDEILAHTTITLDVVLQADVTLDSTLTIPADVNVNLDLNGKTLSYTNNVAAGSSAITNKGNLTITNGTITYEGGGDSTNRYATNTITNSGDLTINGATIINTTTSGASYAIDNAPGSTLVVESGKIESKKTAIRVQYGSDVTINGGDVTSQNGYAVQIHLLGSGRATNLTINGGTFTSYRTDYKMALYSTAYGNNTFAETTVEITGGIFNGDVGFGGGNKTATENVTITGGTFNGALGRYLANDGWEDIAKPTSSNN